MIIKSDKDIIKNYLEDSSNLKDGSSERVVIPEKVEELAEFMKEAYSKKLPVTVSGGGTGTVGSRIPFGGVVVSMEKFDKIVKISRDTMSATVQAGVRVEDLKSSAGSAQGGYECGDAGNPLYLGPGRAQKHGGLALHPPQPQPDRRSGGGVYRPSRRSSPGGGVAQAAQAGAGEDHRRGVCVTTKTF